MRDPVTYETSSGSWSLTVADVNLDGLIDIVTAGAYDDSISVLLGNGDGTFQSYQSFASGHMRIVTTTDLNNDGKLDLVAPNTVDVTILLNDGQPLSETLTGFTNESVDASTPTDEGTMDSYFTDQPPDLII